MGYLAMTFTGIAPVGVCFWAVWKANRFTGYHPDLRCFLCSRRNLFSNTTAHWYGNMPGKSISEKGLSRKLQRGSMQQKSRFKQVPFLHFQIAIDHRSGQFSGSVRMV